jgi:hypothetical protein
MAFDPSRLIAVERERYVLDHTPGVLEALIGRRASTEPCYLIDEAISTITELFRRVADSPFQYLEKKRYVLERSPGILKSLIGRRASDEPVLLLDEAIKTAGKLFDKIDPQCCMIAHLGIQAEMRPN